jgi:hypothetical protein
MKGVKYEPSIPGIAVMIGVAAPAGQSPVTEKPNIIYILADDLQYGTVTFPKI